MRFALALDPTGELAASRAPGLYENAFAEVGDAMVRVSVGRPVCFYAEIPRERTVKLRELTISLVDADAFCEELG